VIRQVLELRLEALSLRDVAEAPDAADALPGYELRLRVALEDAAVLEVEQVVALGVRGCVELPDLALESAGIGELVEDEGDRLAVVSRLHDRLGDPPQPNELHVVACDLPLRVDDEETVCSRLERRLEQRDRACRG